VSWGSVPEAELAAHVPKSMVTTPEAEMDRVTPQFPERIHRNLEEVAEERSAFARWQTMKQREAEKIPEAGRPCPKPSPPEPPSVPVMAHSGVGAIVKTS
jgi:hypothetical protein